MLHCHPQRPTCTYTCMPIVYTHSPSYTAVPLSPLIAVDRSVLLITFALL